MSEAQRAERRASFRKLVLFFGVVFLSVIGYRAWHAWQLHEQTIGDGVNVSSYGYNLSHLNVPEDLLVAARLPKDARKFVLNPKWMSIVEIDALNEKYARQGQWRRVVTSPELVIGTVAQGKARAYPVKFMLWHEIINDTLGGIPIVVTYHPLCTSAVVFDRRVGNEVKEFGFSGLLYNSNLVMYDRQDNREDESLWSQLGMRAIAGKAAAGEGTKLNVLPVYIGTMGKWREAYPETTVFPGDPEYKKLYKDDPYVKYYREKKPIFPVEPLMEGEKGFATWRAVRKESRWVAQPWDIDAEMNQPIEQPAIYSLFFAWHAIRGSE